MAYIQIIYNNICLYFQKSERRQQHATKETEFLRLKRSRLGVTDFEPLKVIGRGAFGEVCVSCNFLIFIYLFIYFVYFIIILFYYYYFILIIIIILICYCVNNIAF